MLFICIAKMKTNNHITIITANYYPEDTAIGLYTAQMADSLLLNGYKVSVITGFPYYPQWQYYMGYQDKSKYYYENINNIFVYRYKQYVPKKVNFIGRVKMMLSLLKGNLRNIKRIEQTNLVICIVPFTVSIFAAYLLAKKHKAKLWLHIQDFEFDLAFDSGIFNSKKLKFFKKTVAYIESKLLNKAQIISSISYGMLNKAQEKSVKTEKYFFPNWVNATDINPDKHTKHAYFSEDIFTLLYSGNIGYKQDWDIFVDVCKKIQELRLELQMKIVGEGAFLTKLKELCKGFAFVNFYELVPYKELNDLLCSADAHFLFQKIEVIDTVMPSKILGMMASGKPSIITGSIKSEVKDIFEQANCGFYIYENAVTEVLNTITYLMQNNESAKKMGKNGREFIINKFEKNNVLNGFTEKINTILN